MKIMPAFLTALYCIFALSSCAILPAEQTAIVTTDIPATSLSAPTDTDYENTVDLETTDTTEVTYLVIDYPPEYYGANSIMLFLDPLLIRWKDIVEESVTNQICAGKKMRMVNGSINIWILSQLRSRCCSLYTRIHPERTLRLHLWPIIVNKGGVK